MKKKIKKIKKLKTKIGYFLMIVGILLPLMSFTKIAFTDFADDFSYREFKRKSTCSDDFTAERKIKKYNERISETELPGLIDPFINEEYDADYDIYKKQPDKVFAYIIIPSLKINMPIRLGASRNHLDRGAAHIDNTSLPVGGRGTRSVIAGHRGWYKGNMFLHINRLKKGDAVYIERNGKKLEYRVYNSEIILPNEWDRLKPEKDRDILTLLTCDPVITTDPKRLLVNCERVDLCCTGGKNVNTGKNSKDIMPGKKSDNKNSQIKKEVLFFKYLIYLIVIAGWITELILVIKVINVFRNNK